MVHEFDEFNRVLDSRCDTRSFDAIKRDPKAALYLSSTKQFD
jgi:hypothetical protein